MATRLDQQIEQLEKMVEERLKLCVSADEKIHRKTPANYLSADPRTFPIDLCRGELSVFDVKGEDKTQATANMLGKTSSATK